LKVSCEAGRYVEGGKLREGYYWKRGLLIRGGGLRATETRDYESRKDVAEVANVTGNVKSEKAGLQSHERGLSVEGR
jgi:hypothetical protein